MSTLPEVVKMPAEELARLREKIRALPKVELHRHLEGSLRFSTLCYYYCTDVLKIPAAIVIDELAARAKGETTESKADQDSDRARIPPQDQLVEAVTQYFCVAKPTDSLTAFLKKFEHTQALFRTYELVERMAYECVEDSYNEGTRVLEIRYSPTYIRGGNPELKLDEIHAAVLRGINRAQEKYPMAVGLIGIMDRHCEPEVVQETIDFIIANKDTFIGVDLANDEAAHNCLDFIPYFNQARAAGLNITVHSGEVPVEEAPEWVLNSIIHLGAQRIGHGFNVMRDPKTVERIVKEHPDVVFEVCPSSNYLCKGVDDVASHPLRAMVASGLKCTLNTDDPGMFLVDMNTECELAMTVLGFDFEGVKKMFDVAYKASFIPEAEKCKYYTVSE